MILNAYSIKDIKVGEFNTPIYVHNEKVALRLFAQDVHNPNSPLSKFPADYELWFVGEFHTETGATIDEGPQFICNGASTILPIPSQHTNNQAAAGPPVGDEVPNDADGIQQS
jgi:hypothetical protein